MPVTASALYNLVQCPQRVALDAFGDAALRDETNPFVRLLWERGTLYEREIIARLDVPFVDLSNLDAQERETRTLEAMRRGDPLIFGGRIASDDLVGIPDLLRRETGGYVPGDIKSGAGEEGGGEESDRKPKVHYAVQLALYVDILERLQFSAGRYAFVWDIHGDEVAYDFVAPQGSKKPETLWDEYLTALSQARAILTQALTPQGAYASVCKLCNWHTFCLTQLTAADDLTLIPFLGRSLRDVMQAAIPTISDLAETNPDGFMDGKKTIFKGVGPDRLRLFQSRAAMLKAPAPRPYLRAPISLKIVPVELFFDIEVDPLRDICYLHGIIERQGGDNGSERFVSFFAETVSPDAEHDAFADAIGYFSNHPNSVIYYYSKYERTIYRKLQAKFPDVCSADDIEQLFDPARAIDLYGDIVLKATEWPTRDYSIKTLARYLGFVWRDTHPSGAASIEWFDRWCREQDPQIRQQILDYNEDDCRATRVLLDGIRLL
jgi:predicted RecB family nuclease